MKTRLIAIGLAFSLSAWPSQAVFRVWLGTGVDNNWSTPGNWTPAGAPQDGDDLFFPDGSARQSNFNDLTGRRLNSINFSAGSGSAYNVSGNGVVLSNGFTCQVSSALATANLPLTLAQNQTFTCGDGFLLLNGDVDLAGHTLTLQVATNCLIGIGGVVKGVGDITKLGPGSASFGGASPNTYAGSLNVTEGFFTLGKSSGNAVTGPLVLGDLWAFKFGTATLSQPHQIADTAPITVNHGQLNLSGWDEAVGPLTLYDGGINTGTATLTLLGTVSAPGFGGYVRNTGIGGTVYLPASVTFNVEADGGFWLGANTFGPGGLIKAGCAEMRVAGTNTFSGAVTVNSGTLTADNSLVFSGTPGVTLNGYSVLGLEGVGITNLPLTLNSANAGIFSVYQNATWAGPIYLNFSGMAMCDGGDLFNPAPLNLVGPIHGTGGLVFGGGGTIRLAGNNDYTGTTRSACRLLLLASTAGRPMAGPLEVGGTFSYFDYDQDSPCYLATATNSTCEVRWLGSYEIPNTALTLHENAVVNLNNFNENLTSLTFNGGEIDTGSGICSFNQPLTANPSTATAFINGHLNMTAPVAYWHISDGPAAPDLQINAVTSGSSSIQKDGPGMVTLTAANTFSGTLFINDGIVSITYDLALGANGIGAGTLVRTGATLQVSSGVTLTEQLSLSGSGFAGLGALNVTGTVTFNSLLPALNYFDLSGPTMVRVEGVGSTFVLNSIISGTGPFTKGGPGRLVMTGGSYPNTFTGDTVATEGTLELNKPQFQAAVPGNLVLGPPPSGGAMAVARFDATGEMGGSVATVNANSLLDLNGNALTLSQLTLNDGGRVQTGTGTLSFFGGAVVSVGSLNRLGAHVSASITGNIALPPNDFISFDVGPYAPFPPFATGPELDVPAPIFVVGEDPRFIPAGFSKNGSGQMRLSGNNSYRGGTSITGGTLIAASPTALGTSNGATSVNNGAALALEGGIAINNESLFLSSSNSVALDSRSGSNTWTGPITLSQTAGISVEPAGGYLQVLSTVSGPGGLTKLGPGTLQFWGFVANTYSGLTTVSQGVLEGGRVNLTSIPGNVIVGDNSTSSTMATVRSLREQQFNPVADVTVNTSGLLDLFPFPSLAPPQASLRTVPGSGKINLGAGTSLSISNPVTFVFSGSVSGSGALIKEAGAGGTMVMSGNSPAFTGPTTVASRDYKLNGNYGNSAITVLSGGRLRGDGVAGNVTVQSGGALAVDSKIPGRNGGDLEMASLSLSSGSGVALDLYGPSPNGGNDELIVDGAASLGNAALAAAFDYPPHEGDVVTLLSKTTVGPITGGFTGWTQGTTRMVGTVPVLVNYTGGDGNDLTLTVTNLALAFFSYRLAEGNGNQTVEPNECDLLYVSLVNRRTNSLTITNAFLRSVSDGATVTIAGSSYPAIPAGGARENLTPFQFRTDPSLPCGTSLDFDLVLGVAGEGEFAVTFTLVGGTDCTHPTGPCESCTLAFGQFTPGTPVTVAPLYFSGAPSICYPPKASPGADPAPALPRMPVLTHSFVNSTTNDLCLTAQLHFDCPGAETNALGVAAYLGNFAINNPSVGYLGDGGSGGPPYPPFSFHVPAGSNFLVTVTARTTNLVCNSYTLELFGLPCPLPTLAIAPDAAPNTVRVQWSTAYPGWTAQQEGLVNGVFSNVMQPPAIVSGRYSLTNITTLTNQFYRLKK